MHNSTDIIRPEIFQGELEVFPVHKNSELEEVFYYLEAGHRVIIEDFYSTGLQLLNELKRRIAKIDDAQFKNAHAARGLYRKLSHQVLAEVDKHKIQLKKAPHIPWLKTLYPHIEDAFAISFPDIQALNSSWQWYEKGIQIPGLPHQIHPWFGVYFPTRFEHIQLFQQYLKENSSSNKTAYDIGCGSGILSFIMEQNGFQEIHATDINPNALKSMETSIQKHHYKNIQLHQGDLFANSESSADLIVFNPPWLPEKTNTVLDLAVYYSPELFPMFFEQAHQRMTAGSKLVLLFSNLLKLTHPNEAHPIEEELKNNNRFQLDRLLQKPIKQASKKTKRNTSRRADELAELWVLEMRDF